MRILIVEDDKASRMFLFEFLSTYGECDLVADGLDALDTFLSALKDNKPYDLVCLDIMLPKVDGVKVLQSIRDLETNKGIIPEKRSKIIMITALAETQMVQKAFEIGCDAYAAKPIDIEKLSEIIEKLGLLKE